MNKRRFAPATQRNREPIASVLEEWLPAAGKVLEVASGTGEHIVYFAERFPRLLWQPTDADDEALRSIDSWRRESALTNVAAPQPLDAAIVPWPTGTAEAVLCINMVHISPWAAALGLLKGAQQSLSQSAPLILYGPWLEEGKMPASSNLMFDADLKRRNPDWGLRQVEAFAAEAERRGFRLEETREMPANNLMLLFRRIGSPGINRVFTIVG